MDGSSSFLTPLLISMAGIVATSLVIVSYHFFVVRYCLRRRLRWTNSTISQTLPGQQFLNGVEEKILITIPVLSYSSKKDDTNTFRLDQTECVICLGELQDGEIVRLLPNCRHSFHVVCIDNWFQGHSSCPICRSPMVEPSETTTVPDVAFSVNVSDDINEVVESLPYDHQFHGQDGGSLTSAVDESAFSPRIDLSSGLLRNSLSIVLPMEGKLQRLSTTIALKRSLSMDQYYALVDIQRESRKESSSSPSASSSSRNFLMECRSFRARSMKQLDRVSSRLVRSLSQLRMGRSSTAANEILPY